MSIVKSFSLFSGLTAASCCFALACSAGGGDGGSNDPIVIDESGVHTQFVINELIIPKTANEAKNYEMDLDGDGATENALGGLLAALIKTANLDLQSGVDDQLADASFILLASIKATDLVNANGVGTYVFFGDNPSPAACTDVQDPQTCGKHLGGTGAFDISATSPTDSIIAGTLAGGDLSTEAGTISIQLPLADVALQLDLIAAHIEATVSATGITSAKLGGAITSDDVDNKLIPAVQLLITDIIAKDCVPTEVSCGCGAGTAGESVLSFFDSDEDCEVPMMELMSNSLIEATLRNPDLDLLDEAGNYNPNSDNIPDSLSLAIGFAAVGGTFDLSLIHI